MPNKTVPLENDKYYHIYNRGNNKTVIFKDNNDYLHFLKLYEKYLFSIVETFVWVLMSNHFHFLVIIKGDKEIDFANHFKKKTLETKPEPSMQFGHVFNAYTKYFNKKYDRTGSLFKNKFKKIEVMSDEYLKYLVYYIHHNPVHHGFIDNIEDYKYSSYQSILSDKKTKIQREEVIDWFDDIDNFRYFHRINQNIDKIKSIVLD